MVMKFTKEDEVLVQIGAMISFLEVKKERLEKDEAAPGEVAELAKKIEEAWDVLCRRGANRRS